MTEATVLGVNGIFVLGELDGAVAEIIRGIQSEFDPKLAANPTRPHVTISGSSGTGPIPGGTPLDGLRDALEPIAARFAPLSLKFGRPMQFMQTNIVVLPLSPHGPLRELHDAIALSGLDFEQARFTFSPHVTLSLYPTLTTGSLRRILGMRVELPAEIRTLSVYRTYDPMTSRKLLELPLK